MTRSVEQLQRIDYALAKQVPSIALRARFDTDYGTLELDVDDSLKVATLVERLLKAKRRKAGGK